MWLSKDPRSGIYRAYWTDASGRQRSITTKQTTEPEARAWARVNHIEEMETATKMGALTPQLVTRLMTGNSCTLQQATQKWEHWASGIGCLSPTTVNQCVVTLNAWARNTGLDNIPVASISTEQISEYVNRPTERKTCTVNNELSVINRFFSFLCGEGIVVRNPAHNCRVNVDHFVHAQRESPRREPFTEGEIETLVAGTDGFWRVAVSLANVSGLRLGDLATLEWDSLSSGGGLVVWTDKTDSRISCALDGRTTELLLALPAPHRGYVFPEQYAIASDPTRRASLSVQFGRVCKRLGIEGKTFHSIRHAFVSKLARQGVDMHSIAKSVGHRHVATTEIYLHA